MEKQIVPCKVCGKNMLKVRSESKYVCVFCGCTKDSTDKQIKDFFSGFGFNNDTGGK